MSMNSDEIIGMLSEDLVSHGILAQYLYQKNTNTPSSKDTIENVLKEMLSSGKVEIGSVNVARPNYVEFVAWKGDTNERVERAMDAVAKASGADKEFAYWLCLRENVDRFEE